ncbi:response regulator transcription factor [Streptomyces noursei]|uniref:response regulator transcription factor n=1 Tax=Streptomyces noursei TaxID=1971 RepID=UPI0033ED9216
MSTPDRLNINGPHTHLPPAIDLHRSSAQASQSSPTLTPAELEVLQLLPSELTVGEIAATRHVSANTINTQLKSIYRKLGVQRRLGAINTARQQALLHPTEPGATDR